MTFEIDPALAAQMDAHEAAENNLDAEYRAVFQDSTQPHREYGRWRPRTDMGRITAENDLPQRPLTPTTRRIAIQTRYVTREDSYIEEPLT